MPIGWTVYYPNDPNGRKLNYLDVLSITGEQSTERFKSLKMWSIPIGSIYVFPDNITGDLYCGNHTWWYSLFPVDVETKLNDSVWVAHNITLPIPYSLTFDVKRCENTVEEFQADWGCAYGEPYPEGGWFKRRACYGGCNVTPKGNFKIYLTGSNISIPSWTIIDYRSSVVDEWKHFAFNLGNLVSEDDTEYTIYFYLDVEDHYNPYCIYIDNVNLVPTLPIPEEYCLSYCDNTTYGLYHRATWTNGVCIFEDEYLSKICMSIGDYTDVEEKGWYCDGTTKVYWDAPQLEWVRIENSEDCIAEAEEEGLTAPFIDPSRMDDPEYVSQQINALILIFLSPAFLSMLISLGVAVIIGAKLDGNWIISLMAFTGLITVFTLTGMFPLILLILLIIIAGLVVAKTMFGFFGGK